MSNKQKHHVTVESIEDSEPQLIKDQDQGVPLIIDDPAASSAQAGAPSDQYTDWNETANAEKEARQERQNPAEAAQDRQNATQTAHIMEDYIHEHKH